MKRRYDNIFLITIFHLGAFLALFYFSWFWLLIGVGVWTLSHGPGLAVGFHRLLTHRGFKTAKWIEYSLTILGNLALQGGHIKWIAIHRKHHQFTEKDGDPHSPRHGFVRSHIGWLIDTDPSLNNPELLTRYTPDLMNQPFHRILNKVWWLPSVILGLTLFYFWGLPAMLWVIFVPVAVGLQFTWLVNSACHRWGSRLFATDDDSTNNWWVALLTFGEGWHNNHHDTPTRARHGLKWYQIDVSWIFIWSLHKMRLAYAIKL